MRQQEIPAHHERDYRLSARPSPVENKELCARFDGGRLAHLVSAFDIKSALVLGHIEIDDKSNELPFWINLYNALTVKVVLDHYPVESIKDIDISPGLFADGPWGKKLVTVEDEALSLDDIEHRILRPI